MHAGLRSRPPIPWERPPSGLWGTQREHRQSQPINALMQYPAVLDDMSWLGGPEFALPTVALQGCCLPLSEHRINQYGGFGRQWERMPCFGSEMHSAETWQSWTGPLFRPEEEGYMPQFQLNCRTKHIKRRKSPELRKAVKHMGLGYHLENFALMPLHFFAVSLPSARDSSRLPSYVLSYPSWYLRPTFRVHLGSAAFIIRCPTLSPSRARWFPPTMTMTVPA